MWQKNKNTFSLIWLYTKGDNSVNRTTRCITLLVSSHNTQIFRKWNLTHCQVEKKTILLPSEYKKTKKQINLLVFYTFVFYVSVMLTLSTWNPTCSVWTVGFSTWCSNTTGTDGFQRQISDYISIPQPLTLSSALKGRAAHSAFVCENNPSNHYICCSSTWKNTKHGNCGITV